MTRIHFLLLLLLPVSLVSQNLRFFQGTTDVTNKLITVNIEPQKDFETPIAIFNSSGKPANVYLKRKFSRPIPPNYELFFAFDKIHYAAMPDLTYTYPNTVSIAPGEKMDNSSDRDGLIPFLRTGGTCFDFAVTFILSDINQIDSAQVTIQYTCTNSIKEEQAGNFSTPYPIPAHTNAFIDYTFYQSAKKSSLILYNTLGKSVKEISLDNTTGKINIDLNGLPSGFYFYSFVNNARIVHSGKLLVSDQ